VGLFYGEEAVQDLASQQHGRRYRGVRLSLQKTLDPRSALYGTAAYQTVRHDAMDPVFAKVREDDFAQLRVGYARQISKGVTATLDVSATDNSSNLSLYTYDRQQIMGNIRYAVD
jgi:hypothetical protein